MQVLPFISKKKDKEPVLRCINDAARSMGVSGHFMATAMSHFLERLMYEVAEGQLIRIPGFGVFGSHLFKSRMKGKPPHCMPSFAASRAFKNAVRETCMPDMNTDKELIYHRRNSNVYSTNTSDRSRPFTAMDAFRDRVRADAERRGVKWTNKD
jgi:nucleoid DNA-binding protein